MAPNDHPIYLTNSTASNVRGRPDRGSTWLAIPAANIYGEITIKKEHNAPFSVVVHEKGIPKTLVHGVTSVKATVDIEMYDVGIYTSWFDLETASEIRAYTPRGQKKIQGKCSPSPTFGYELREFEVAKGWVQARDVETLIFDSMVISESCSSAQSTEAKGESLQELRNMIETAMDTLQSSESSDHDKKVARQVAETTLVAFLDVSMS